MEQPDVLDGDHRLVGESFKKLDLRRGKGAHLHAARFQLSNEFLFKRRGVDKSCVNPLGTPKSGNSFCGAGIGNVERAMLAYPAKPWPINTHSTRPGVWVSDQNEPGNHTLPLPESQHYIINPTNPGGALDDGIENRLHIRRRAADDAENLGRRRLMLQGLAQFRVALLDLFKQPYVLDSDDGLVGEGLYQLDLPVSEWLEPCLATLRWFRWPFLLATMALPARASSGLLR